MSLLNIGDWFSGANTRGLQTQSEADKNLALQQAKLRKQADDAFDREDYGYFGTAKMAINENALGQKTESTSTAAAKGFAEGLGDGVKNIKNAVTGFGPFKLIPIWVWIAGGVGLFFYLGGLPWLKRKLNR